MNSTETVPLANPPRRIRKRYLFLASFLGVLLACGFGIVSVFRLSSDTRALRDVAVQSIGVQCDRKVALHVGGLATGLARAVSRFFDLAPEVRAGVQALRGAEVAVYEVRRVVPASERVQILAGADREMHRRGWMRIVGVMEKKQLVAIYVPAESLTPHQMKCSVLVLEDENLVIVSARGDIEPLLELARSRIDFAKAKQQCGELIAMAAAQ